MKLKRSLIFGDIPVDQDWYGRNCNIQDSILTIYNGYEWDGMSGARDGKRDDEGKPYTWKASCS